MKLVDLLDEHTLRTGLAAGVVALVVVLLVVLVLRRHGSLLPAAGLAVVAASVVALDRAGPRTLLSGRLVAGLALLAIGPFLTMLVPGRRRASPWIMALTAVPGAVVVASAAADANDLGWVPPLVFVSTVIGGALVADFDQANAPAGLAPVLLLIATAAMCSTLPDTEQILVVVGAALPLAVLGWPVALAALGPGAYCTVGLLGWVAAVGGRGRPGAVVGAIACLGVMLIEPLVRRAWRGRVRVPTRPVSRRATLVIVLQVATVIATARVAGLELSGARAAVISLATLAGTALGVAVLLAPRRGIDAPAPTSAPDPRASPP